MGFVTYPYQPSGGDMRSIDGVMDNFDAIAAVLNGNIEAANLAADSVGDSELVSPPWHWRPLWTPYHSFGHNGPNPAAGSTLTIEGRTLTDATMYGCSDFWNPVEAADIAVPGKTTRCRIKGVMFCNSTAPTGTWTVGLRGISAPTGGSSTLTFTYAAAIATAAVVTPAANSVTEFTSAEFDYSLLVSQAYTFVRTNSATPATNSTDATFVALEYKHV